MHAVCDDFSHVFVLICDRQLNCAFAPFFVQILLDKAQGVLAAFEEVLVMVADKVVKLSMSAVTGHGYQMEESFVSFGSAWCLKTWQHLIDLHSYQAGVDHGVLGGTRMYAEAGDLEFCLAGVEVLILDLALGVAVQSIAILSAELLYIEVRSAGADLLVRSEGNGDWSVRHLCLV